MTDDPHAQLSKDQMCVWTRLPDIQNPLELHQVSFRAECNGFVARGAYPFFPDYCPGCGKKVIVVKDDSQQSVVPSSNPRSLLERLDPDGPWMEHAEMVSTMAEAKAEIDRLTLALQKSTDAYVSDTSSLARQRNEAYEALGCLLPGLELDLRYADDDDDKDALRSRVKTVRDALSGASPSAHETTELCVCGHPREGHNLRAPRGHCSHGHNYEGPCHCDKYEPSVKATGD